MATNKGKLVAREDRPFGDPKYAPPSGMRYVEAKKMVAFICPEGQHFGSSPAQVKECQDMGHDPYYSDRYVEITKPAFVEERDEKTGEITRIVTKTKDEDRRYKLVRTPNWEQVPYDVIFDSGTLPQKRLNQGWVWPEDLGFAPFCDYLNCSVQNPKFVTPVGTYHHRDEAALMYLAKGGSEDSTEGTAIFVDDTTSGRRRRKQLNEAANEAIIG